MNTAPTLYRIVVFATPEDRLEAAAVLRECLSLLPTDAAIQARLLPGVVNGEYPRESAERAAAGISELGPHAEAIPSHLVPVLHPCESPRHLRWPVGELQVVDARGEIEHRIAWDDVELVSVGQVPLDSTRHSTPPSTTVLAAGRHIVPEGNSTSPLAAGPEAYIVCKNPRRVYLLDHKRLNYEFLGDRRTESATTNFRQFLVELVAQTPGAYLPPWTVAYLASDALNKFDFSSPGELERATVLHLLIRRRTHPATVAATP